MANQAWLPVFVIWLLPGCHRSYTCASFEQHAVCRCCHICGEPS